MPTYGYRCKECDHSFEVFQKITDPAKTECEKCGGPVKKLLYPVGIQFKGPGFYVNDYSGSTARATAEKAESAATETKSDVKTETKTESTASAKPAATAP